MLRLESVSKTYTKRGMPVVALHPTTLEIASGEFVAVVGPSGSGKTTLLSLVGGMLAPSTGKVWLDGQSLYQMRVKKRTALRRSRIGFIFQSFNLVPYLTALENVQVPLFLAGLSPKKQRKLGLSLLKRVGLADRVHHKPGELSVGQQQRVAFVRMIANDPALILADEPTGNLDPDTKEVVMEFLDALHREGRTIIVVTHDPTVAAFAWKTICLVDGKMTVEGERPQTAPAA